MVFLSRALGENNDNTSAPGEYALTREERALPAGLRERFAKVVAVLNVGYPVAMDWADLAGAIVCCGYGGMLGGQALLEVLSGAVAPSGKLPDTWAVRYEVPCQFHYRKALPAPEAGLIP